MLHIPIPGSEPMRMDHLLLDANGTLTLDGQLLAGIKSRVRHLREELGAVWLVSADTFGTAEDIAVELGADYRKAASDDQKLQLLRSLDSDRCVVVGNGRNDAAVLAEARLGIAVIGPEGASAAALNAADVLCATACDALDLLLNPRRLAATLRP
jgi:P-type E1-E2 ATPase